MSNDKSEVLFNAEEIARDCLTGSPPCLDSFVTSLAFARIGFQPELSDWIKDIKFIPAFAFFGQAPNWSYYRLTACHPYYPAPDQHPDIPILLHTGFETYDFLVHFLSDTFLNKSIFYESYPAILSFAQAQTGIAPPSGSRWFIVDGTQYLQLFHHTDTRGITGILSDKFMKPSLWNFCGTRRLNTGHCYFTDIPSISSAINTLPLLIRTDSGMNVHYRTDDQREIVSAGVQVQDRDFGSRLNFLISPTVIQPNPMVYHNPVDGQPKWLEIEYPHIYRCPCSGIRLSRSMTIDGEQHWIVDTDSIAELRTSDPICCANGNNPESLLILIDDFYIPTGKR